MALATTANFAIFRDRDFFVHDGSRLRRVRLSAPVQAAMLFLTLALLGWAGFATTKMLSPTAPQGQFAELAAATEARARQIEQRQEVLVALLAGERVDPTAIEAVIQTSDVPGDLDAPLARAEATQELHAAATVRALDIRYQHAAAELKRLGITADRLNNGGVGGPFEAIADPTFKQLFKSWKKLDNLQSGAIAVPSDKPVRTGAFTSGYGVRSDPFQGRAAMHAGIDLAGKIGTPIYATADGVITTAAFNSGGYGNLIKIDHGRGIETRYGHLSSIGVRAGQRVKRGELIGGMGSTGRSTGSHLHYEVRVDGRAVNPIPFMKSTDYLVAMQRNASSHSMDNHVALGGPTAGGAKR
ncbi:MAG: M23 family metallopeptidase [Pseudomonadota bacterium]|nr:M23 family metallopeptidase [Pseudomonadota bacterium]